MQTRHSAGLTSHLLGGEGPDDAPELVRYSSLGTQVGSDPIGAIHNGCPPFYSMGWYPREDEELESRRRQDSSSVTQRQKAGAVDDRR